ncbi:MAG TPA: hypothetical protein VNL35_03820, partial [Chloroflexota bacterium]|nr:hypothetical protein [Chloroflexota bacterium]
SIDSALSNLHVAWQGLDESQVQGRGESNELIKVARFLASSPGPCTATQVARAMSASHTARRADVPRILAMLNACSAFVRVGRSRWQLGNILAEAL